MALRKKTSTKKSAPKAVKAPVKRSFEATVLRQYDRGASYQELADKHETSVEKIAAIVEADQAKNVTE